MAKIDISVSLNPLILSLSFLFISISSILLEETVCGAEIFLVSISMCSFWFCCSISTSSAITFGAGFLFLFGLILFSEYIFSLLSSYNVLNLLSLWSCFLSLPCQQKNQFSEISYKCHWQTGLTLDYSKKVACSFKV